MTRKFDHLVLPVNDLAQARGFYERLGFTTTPDAQHPWGTSNFLVQLQGCFLEVLSVTRPELIAPAAEGHFNFGAFNREFLAKRQGMSMLVFRSDDACSDQAEFTAKGLQTYAPFDFQRQAKLPDGREVTVGFSLAFVTHPDMSDAVFFCCQQHAPQYFWRPEYQRHSNGAMACSGVTMTAAEPAAFSEFFAKLRNCEPVATAANEIVCGPQSDEIKVVTPERFGELSPGNRVAAGACFAAFRIVVADLAATASLLQDAGIDARRHADGLQVGADQAFGVTIEFVASGQ